MGGRPDHALTPSPPAEECDEELDPDLDAAVSDRINAASAARRAAGRLKWHRS
jgi:hypothetical protein